MKQNEKKYRGKKIGNSRKSRIPGEKETKTPEDGRTTGPQGKWHILEHIAKSATEHLEGMRDAVKKASASSTKKNERQKTKKLLQDSQIST